MCKAFSEGGLHRLLSDGVTVYAERTLSRLRLRGTEHVLELGPSLSLPLHRRLSKQGSVSVACCERTLAGFSDHGWDACFSVFGTSSFERPEALMPSLARRMKPKAQLAMAVLRSPAANPFVTLAKEVAERHLQIALPRGQGDFALSDRRTLEALLSRAGFTRVTLEQHDVALRLGRSVEDAIDLSLRSGPACEHLCSIDTRTRLAIAEDLDKIFRRHRTVDGVHLASSAWIVTAENGDHFTTRTKHRSAARP